MSTALLSQMFAESMVSLLLIRNGYTLSPRASGSTAEEVLMASSPRKHRLPIQVKWAKDEAQAGRVLRKFSGTADEGVLLAVVVGDGKKVVASHKLTKRFLYDPKDVCVQAAEDFLAVA